MSLNRRPADIPTQPQSSSVRFASSILLLAVLLSLVTLVAYIPSFQSGFIEYDDPLYVTANPYVRTGLSWNNVAWAFSATALDMGIWGPLTWLSHMTDCQFFGLNPAGHHATSVVLHALNAVLLFLLLYKATGFRWRSLMVAALFALHPLNVENVAWIAERKSILSMFFSLCTVGLYGWYARAPHWSRYVSVVAAFALALLSKPMAVTLPVVLLLMDYWPLGRISLAACNPDKARIQLRHIVLEKAPLFLMSAVFSWIAILSEKHIGAISTLTLVPFHLRIENAALSYVIYIRKMIWPCDLAYFYPHRGSELSWWHASLAALLLLAVTGLVYSLRRRHHLVFGWAFFLITLLPVIGILQIGAFSMADRYAYIPLIGLFIALVWECADGAAKFHLSASFQSIIALLVVALAASCTMITAGYWHSNLTLFAHAQRVTSPPNVFIETNLAGALSDEGRINEALVCYRRAESLAPTVFFTHYNLGYSDARIKEYPAAIDQFHQALRYASSSGQKARALNSLGIACLNLDDKQQALAAFTQLLALQPHNAEAEARIKALRSLPEH